MPSEHQRPASPSVLPATLPIPRSLPGTWRRTLGSQMAGWRGLYCPILGDGLPHPAQVGSGTQAQVRRTEDEFLMAFQPRRPLVGLLEGPGQGLTGVESDNHRSSVPSLYKWWDWPRARAVDSPKATQWVSAAWLRDLSAILGPTAESLRPLVNHPHPTRESHPCPRYRGHGESKKGTRVDSGALPSPAGRRCKARWGTPEVLARPSLLALPRHT